MARSNSITIEVADPPLRLAADATGATSVAMEIESPLMAAGEARPTRLTQADLASRFPDDDGFKFADRIVGKKFTFFTKGLQKAYARNS